MWLLFGILAIFATAVNLILYFIGKDYKLAMAAGLSLTALTLCAENSQIANWVEAEDWAALADVVPGMERVWWFLTIVSIGLNLAPLLLEYRKNRS
ncbi:hypothetical protein A0126_16550 (plasmid) [Exiguobacterium sp. N4-1P]|uniref:hypothetical protein n=1 Tax=unclassified Exiguobacterium TaxID=2644629 RepID=UPI000B58AC46|nr:MULTISPECIES: hypothetical protein [unclassified Exiguobacterium]ASI35190.1 hypothetical protein A0126_06275 [Exiguobacterium sp. N4-1P]ASI37203.1 hypothetical protein A0126_16550 [Exiguobacterium sp. N4-1P]